MRIISYTILIFRIILWCYYHHVNWTQPWRCCCKYHCGHKESSTSRDQPWKTLILLDAGKQKKQLLLIVLRRVINIQRIIWIVRLLGFLLFSMEFNLWILLFNRNNGCDIEISEQVHIKFFKILFNSVFLCATEVRDNYESLFLNRSAYYFWRRSENVLVEMLCEK